MSKLPLSGHSSFFMSHYIVVAPRRGTGLNRLVHHDQGNHASKMRMLLLFFLATIVVSSSQGSDLGLSHQIHLLRPQSGNKVPGLSCLSWRLGVETRNIIGWTTVPKECEGVQPYNSTLFNQWVITAKAPALPESMKLYKTLLSLGIKVVFLTGRSEEQRTVTTNNLNHVGFHTWEKLILKASSYKGKTAVEYKSTERKKLEKNGYRIIGNIGDQWSDLMGTPTGNRTFKLPDPMYYIS
ncbi:acid phosphatase 1 [Quercus suber]|uniref:Acid phosphatase 1 n=1 Tax=Quercus suber TaxID=58331 RepID=A0AAW0M436_QUESU